MVSTLQKDFLVSFMTTYSLFIGRFQPLHKGHFTDIKKITDANEHCIIAIGSTNIQPTFENPLTYKERKEIIKKVLDTEKIPRNAYTILSVPDIGNDELWPEHVRTCVMNHMETSFSKIYTGSNYTEKLFIQDNMHEVIKIQLLKDDQGDVINATTIRDSYLHGKPRVDLLHEITAQYLKELAFKDRLVTLAAEGSQIHT